MTVAALSPYLAACLGDQRRAPLPRPCTGEWQVILEQASEQGLTHLLQGLPALPPDAVEQVRQDCFRFTVRNLALAGELRSILRAFRNQGLECAPLRGLALTERLYGEIVPRPMGDIDLLVRREDVRRIQALFRALGFTEVDRRPGFAAAYYYTLEFFVERSFTVIVEPHWTIAYPPYVDRLDMEAVWERCVPARVAGEETLALGGEDLLVHLCLHWLHRDDAPLLWLHELDRLLRQEADGMDWELVLSVSRQAGVERLVSRALGEAVRHFGSPVPHDLVDGLRRRNVGWSGPTLAQRLSADSGVDGRESLALFFALEGIGAKLRYARALLFPQPEFMILHYGLRHRRQLGPAYVRRLLRLSWDGAKGVSRLLLVRRA